MPPTQSYPQRLSDQLGDSDPIGLKMFAIGGVGVVLGIGVLIGSQILFIQRVSPTVWKIIIGAVGAGLPIGLTGGILLIDPDPQLRYIRGSLLSSLGALLLFEITYPVGWATKYHRVGTFMYVSGTIVLLGLAAWAMRDWFEDDTESTGTETGSIEANDEEEDEKEVDDDTEDIDPNDESVGSDGEKGAGTDSSDGSDVGTTSRRDRHNDQSPPLEVRVKNVNAEVRRLKTQLRSPGVSGSEPEPDALEPRIEAVVNRVDEMMPEIARLVDQTWALENNLDELGSGLDRMGSETAQSVSRVQGKFPDFRGHDTAHRTAPVDRSTPSARQRSAPGDGPSRASARRPAGSQRKRRTGSPSNTQQRVDPKYRRSNRSRKTAPTTRGSSQGRSLEEFVDDHLWIKALLAALGISVVIFISFFVQFMGGAG